MAKPELECPVEVTRRSLLPVGRIDLAVEALGYIDSGFALGPVASIQNAHATELTHATRIACRHNADRLPWSRNACAVPIRLPIHSGVANPLIILDLCLTVVRSRIESPGRKLKGYAVGAWGNLCKAELPSGGKAPLTTKSLSATPV